jgi:hypothetical protein
MSASASVSINVGQGDLEKPNTNGQITESLRSHSVCVNCILCNQANATEVAPYYNILNCLFCYFCTEFWCCYLMWVRKDWNCYNAKHVCGNKACHQYIDTYQAC